MNNKMLGLFNLIFVLLFIFLMWADQDVIRTNAFMTIIFPSMVLFNYVKVIQQSDKV